MGDSALEQATEKRASRRGRWLWAPVVALAVFCAVPVLDNAFANDDDILIVNNAYVHDFSHLSQNLRSDFFFSTSGGAIGYYRPLVKVAFMLQYQWFGNAPLGYHVVSVVCFALLVLVAYRFGLTIGLSPPFAAIGVAFLATHPAQAESVGVVTSQSDLFAAMLMLAALLCYMRWANRGGVWRAVAAVVSHAAALGCKETAVTVVLFATLFEVFRARKQGNSIGWRRLAVFSLPLLAYGGLRFLFGIFPIHVDHDAGGLGYVTSTAAVWDRALLRALFSAAWDPYLHAVRPLASAKSVVLYGLPAVLSLGAAAWAIWRAPTLRWATMLIVLPLLPILGSSMVHTSTDPRSLLVSDRWVTLSALGAGLLWAQLTAIAWHRVSRRMVHGALAVGWGAVLIVSALEARLENASLRTEESRTRFVGAALKARGNLAPSELEYVLVSDAFALEGKRPWAEIVSLYRRVVALQPDNYNYRYNLARALYLAKRYPEAAHHAWIAFFGRDPQTGKPLPKNDSLTRHRPERAFLLGLIAEALKQTETARMYYQKALALNPRLDHVRKRFGALERR